MAEQRGWGSPDGTAPDGSPPDSPAASPQWPPQGPPQGPSTGPTAPAGPAGPAPPSWGGTPAGEAPAAKPGVVPLRPLGFGELLDGAFATVQRYPTVMLGMSAAIMAVVVIVGYLTLFLGFGDLLRVTDTDLTRFSDETWVSFGLSMLGLGVLLWIGSACLTGMITVTVSRGVLGRPVTIPDVWRVARPHIHRLLGLTLALGCAYAVALIVTIVVVAAVIAASPAVGAMVAILAFFGWIFLTVLVGTRTVAASAALVLETRPADPSRPDGEQRRIGIVAALRRSWSLIKGRTPRTFGVVFVANLIGGIVSSIVQVAFTLLATLITLALGNPAGGGGSGLVVGLVTGVGYVAAIVLQFAFLSAVNALVYVDARMRAEGLDIELTSALARDPSSPAPWTVR